MPRMAGARETGATGQRQFEARTAAHPNHIRVPDCLQAPESLLNPLAAGV